MKVNSLTPEQESQIPVYRDKWIANGISVGKCDREKAEAEFKAHYKCLKLPEPKIFWTNSPKEAMKMADRPKADVLNNFCYGSHDAAWLSFYDYFIEVVGLDLGEPIKHLIEISKCCGWWIPFEDKVIVSEKPVEIHLINGDTLHNEKGAAILYPDGYSIYALNGVRCPAWVVETPWDDIDCRKALAETNVEIRRELVRKVGVERMVQKLGAKVIDKEGDYELLDVDLGLGRFTPFLKMLNPSIQTWHVEGVPATCRTVAAALEARNGTKQKPDILT